MQGNLGEVGLARAPPVLHGQTLASKPETKAASIALTKIVKDASKLAFGDAKFVPSKVSSSDREGSVRGKVAPDFHPPLGDLGETGLAAKSPLKAHILAANVSTIDTAEIAPSTDMKASVRVLAEETVGNLSTKHIKDMKSGAPTDGMTASVSRRAMDDYFTKQVESIKSAKVKVISEAAHVSDDKSRKETEQFYQAQALRDAPRTKQAEVNKRAAMSGAEARKVIDDFYSRKALAMKRLDAKKSAAGFTAEMSRSQLGGYFSLLTDQDAKDHMRQVTVANTVETAAHSEMANYFDALETKDAKLHASAMARKAKENGAAQKVAVCTCIRTQANLPFTGRNVAFLRTQHRLPWAKTARCQDRPACNVHATV